LGTGGETPEAEKDGPRRLGERGSRGSVAPPRAGGGGGAVDRIVYMK